MYKVAISFSLSFGKLLSNASACYLEISQSSGKIQVTEIQVKFK